MSCTITYNGDEYSEADFIALLVSGEYENLIKEGLDLPPIPKDVQEAIRKEITELDLSGEERNRLIERLDREMITPKAFSDQLSDERFNKGVYTTKKMLENGQRVLEEKGTQGLLNQLKDSVTATPEIIAALTIAIRDTSKAISLELAKGNEAEAAVLNEHLAKIFETLSRVSTNVGRTLKAVDILNTFVYADPELADFYVRKEIANSNEKIKQSGENITSAETIVQTVNDTVNEVKTEVAENISAEINEKFKRELNKGIGKNATEQKKQQVRDYFSKIKDKFKDKDGKVKTYSSVIGVTPEVMIKLVEAVEEAMIRGIGLQAAIIEGKTKLLKEFGLSPKEAEYAVKAFKEEISTPRVKSAKQLENEAANKEYQKAKEEYSKKQKELKDKQKEIEKAEDKSKKQLEKDIQRLTNEVINASKNLDQNVIEDIIQMFYSNPDRLQSDLEKMVVEALGVSEREAVDIAQKISNQLESKIRTKLINKIGLSIKQADVENKPVKTNPSYVDKLASGIRGSNAQKQYNVIDKLIQLSMMNVLDTETIFDLMGKKYGLKKFTIEDSNYVKQRVSLIKSAETETRRNAEIAKLLEFIADKAPLGYNSAMHTASYGAILSGLGTSDTNLTFNLLQLKYTILFSPFNNLIQSIRSSKKVGVKNATNGFFKNLIYQVGRIAYQDKLASDKWLKLPLSSSMNNFLFGMRYGTTSYAENEQSIEKLAQTETNYGRLGKFFKPLNYYKYAGRILASVDMAGQEVVKNTFLPIMLREQLINEGLTTPQIDAQIKQQIVTNKIEEEVAEDKAIKDILKYDIEIVNEKDKFVIYYDGNIKKSRFGNKIQRLRRRVDSYNSKAEAEQAALEFVKKQTMKINRWKTDYIQQKINRNALRSAQHLAQESLISSKPTSMIGQYVFEVITSINSNAEKKAKELESEAMAKVTLRGKAQKMAQSGFFFGLSMAILFAKTTINIAEIFLVRYNLLGLIKYYRINNAVKNPNTPHKQRIADFYRTQTQIDALMADAVLGTVITAYKILMLLTEKREDDELEKKDKEKAEELINTSNLKEEFQSEYGEAILDYNNFLLKPKNGERFGSLAFLPPNIVKALEAAGLAKANAEYVGDYPNGKFVSIISNPRRFNLVEQTLATLAMYQKYVVTNQQDKTAINVKKRAVDNMVVQAAMYGALSYLDVSFMKRTKSIAEGLTEGKPEDYVVPMLEKFFPITQVTNPAFVSQFIRYNDGFARMYVKPSNGWSTYLGSKTPFIGSLVGVYGSDKKYGMFGEEMYSIPAMNTGGISEKIFSYKFSDKNKEEKEMYQYLADKGVLKIFSMPKNFVNEKLEKITELEHNKIGAEAGREVFKKLKEAKGLLDSMNIVTYDKNGNKITNPNTAAIDKYVTKLFSMEYANAWYKYTGQYDQENIKKNQEKFDKQVDKIEKQVKETKENVEKYDISSKEIVTYNTLLIPSDREVRIKNIVDFAKGYKVEGGVTRPEALTDEQARSIIVLERLREIEKARGGSLLSNIDNYKEIAKKLGVEVNENLKRTALNDMYKKYGILKLK